MGRTLIISGLLGLTAACTRTEPTFIPLDAEAYDFIVMLPVNDGAVSTERFVFDRREESTGAIDLELGALEAIILIGLEESSMKAALPGYAAERAAEELSFLPSIDPSCGPTGRLITQGRVVEAPLPAGSEVFIANADEDFKLESTSLAELDLGVAGLRVPVDPERCDDAAPLAPRVFALPPRGVSGQAATAVRGIHRLDDDRMIAIVGGQAVLLERGVPTETSTTRVALWDPSSGLHARALAVEPTPSGLRLFVSGDEAGLLDARRPAVIVSVEYEAGLGFGPVETTTRTPTPIDTLVLDPVEGRLVALARPSTILVRDAPGAPFEAVMLPGGDVEKVTLLHLTGLPEEPFAVAGGGAGRLLLGSRDARTWRTFDEGLGFGANVRGLGIVHRSTGTEYWVGNTFGRAFRRFETDTEWRETPIHLPPSFGARGCPARPTNPCGWIETSGTYRAFVPLDAEPEPQILATIEQCLGLLDLRGARCAEFVPLSEGPLGLNEEMRVVVTGAGWLTLGTDDGHIFELPLPPVR